MKRYYVFFAILVAICGAAIVGQTMVNGPVKADRDLAERIRLANDEVQAYSNRNGRLPADLSSVKGSYAGVEYQRLDNDRYELCGTFQTINMNNNKIAPVESSYIDTTYHTKGRQCFTAVTEPTVQPL